MSHNLLFATLKSMAVGAGMAAGISVGVALAAFSYSEPDFEPLETISARAVNTRFAEIADRLNALETPAGTVAAFAGPTAAIPSGWMLCDGRALSRSQYARLFAAIGTVHGDGDGATTFPLPDYRGLFLRGVDAGRGMDPDAATRSVAGEGGNEGDQVGSRQGDETRSHNHRLGDSRGVGIGPAKFTVTGDGNSFWSEFRYNNGGDTVYAGDADAVHAQNSGGAETRPVNAAVHYIIKL